LLPDHISSSIMLGISSHALMLFARKQFNCDPSGVQYSEYRKIQTRMQDVNTSLSRLITWHCGSESRRYSDKPNNASCRRPRKLHYRISLNDRQQSEKSPVRSSIYDNKIWQPL